MQCGLVGFGGGVGSLRVVLETVFFAGAWFHSISYIQLLEGQEHRAMGFGGGKRMLLSTAKKGQEHRAMGFGGGKRDTAAAQPLCTLCGHEGAVWSIDTWKQGRRACALLCGTRARCGCTDTWKLQGRRDIVVHCCAARGGCGVVVVLTRGSRVGVAMGQVVSIGGKKSFCVEEKSLAEQIDTCPLK